MAKCFKGLWFFVYPFPAGCDFLQGKWVSKGLTQNASKQKVCPVAEL